MKKFQSGQVLPLGLVLVVVGLVGALIIYNTGVVASDKMRLANSADASAYSGALWQARALNYQAYANRAMVANQVAIGQAVSLQSWMTYAAVAGENLATITSTVPVLNVVTGSIQSITTVAETGVSAAAKAMLLAANVATKALSLSQDAIHAATLYNTSEMISVVARDTDSRFTTNSAYGLTNKALNVADWLTFNSRYNNTDREAMKERHELILASRDEFTHARNWDLFDFWVPSSLLTWHKLRRQGDSTLVSVDTESGLEWEWMAKDTLSIHTKTLGFFGSRKVELPVSWASAFANSKNSTSPLESQGCDSTTSISVSRNCDWFTKNNHVAEDFANNNVTSLAGRQTLKPISGYGGVRSFWVLSDRARSAEDARLRIRVEVTLPAQDIRESNTLISEGHYDAPVVVAGNVMSSISAADVYYKHPQHYDLPSSGLAKANAYNPYWQAQLADISDIERKAVILTRRGGSAPTVVARRVNNTNGLRHYQGGTKAISGDNQ